MPNPFVDLHCHSTASDGTLSPRDVVRLAHEIKLSALALTDHDTVGGIAEAQAEAHAWGIDFLPGIEISAKFPYPGTLHILGYGIDPANAALQQMTADLREGRDDRNERIVAKLQKLGIEITIDEVLARAQGTVGRPHIAQVLVAKGVVSHPQAAFDKYLGQGGLAYEDKERFTPREAIAMIHAAGGVAICAHPTQLKCPNLARLERVLKDLVDLGLDGVEVIHSDHRPFDVRFLNDFATKHKLLKSGGSDFHGTIKSNVKLGIARSRTIPRAYFDAIRERLATR
jgi:predicted metal-dependent phosphoesterase TrpH